MSTNQTTVSSILSRLFSRKRDERRTRKARAGHRGRVFHMEGLEKREMFAVTGISLNPIINYSNPYAAPQYSLVVATDNNSTSVSVSPNGSSITLNDNTTSRHWDFPASMIQRVEFYGGAGADRFVDSIPTMPVWAYGQGGNDYLEGYNAPDILDGGMGNDTLVGFGGADSIQGGGDNDFIQGMAGNDELQGGAGNDYIEGGADNDNIYGGADDDTLLGGIGNDNLYGGAGNDHLNGQAGFDYLSGGENNDVLISIDGAFNETVDGGNGSDVLWVDGINNVFQRGFDSTLGVTSADTLNLVGGFSNGADLTLDGDNIADPSDIGSKLTFRNNITAANTLGSNPLFAGPGFTLTSSGMGIPVSGGPKSTDVAQGNLGDCWITASLSSMAIVNPDVITRNVVDFNDGTYGVRLGSGYYRVDNELSVKNTANGAVSSNLQYAKLGSQNSMWVAVVEKAFASYTSGAGTYAKIDGGFEKDVFKAFRMNDVGSHKLSSTYGSATYMANDFYNRYLNGYSQTISIEADDTSWHAFTVAGFTRDAAGAIAGIVLRNPWGYDGLNMFTKKFSTASAGSSTTDGQFTVSISQLFNSGGWTDWARA